MLRDLQYGLRMLRRTPGMSALAILCLTLGIGANAAVFSWIEGLLLKPYPLVANGDRLFVLSGTSRSATKGTDVSWPDFVDLRRTCTLADAFIAEKIVGTTLSFTGDRAERVPGSIVSANYFDALGLRPVLGRTFEPAEETGRNAHPVVVIGYQLWQDRFHGDPSVIGRTQVMNGVPHTIIGVMPEDFYGTFVGYRFQFWVPASMQEVFEPGGYTLEDRGSRWIEGFVRLKPGVTRAAAQAELDAAARRLEQQYPATNRGRGLELLPLWQSPFNPMDVLAPTLGIAIVVVGSVLLIACANVGNLLLLKSIGRRREMAIRLAVGAGRARLIRQLLTEALLLSAVASAGGLLVAHWWRNALVLLFPPRGGAAMRLPADLDWRVLLASVAVSVGATVLFGLAPAVLTSGADLTEALKAEAGGVVGGRGRAWVRGGLVVLQVSLSFVLLVGAGLVVRSLLLMRAASPGFRTAGVLATSVDTASAGYDPARTKIFHDALLERLAAVGGIESASFVRVLPFSYRGYSTGRIAVDGYEAPPDEPPIVEYDEAGEGYLDTVGIPIVSGRGFTRSDDERSAPVAIVNEAMIARFWRGQDPVGRRLIVNGREMRVVGVAKMSKYQNLLEPPTPFFYVPLRQNGTGAGLVLRTTIGPQAMARVLAREIRAIDAGLAPGEVISMREQVDRMTASQSVAVTLLLIFGGLAVVLAAIGLYGVMSAAVSQARREFGLRLALGASPRDLVRLILTRGLVLSAAGLAAGAVAAAVLTRLLGSLLYHVGPRDPAAFVAAAALMGAASLLACAVPAWRATRTTPLVALRGD